MARLFLSTWDLSAGRVAGASRESSPDFPGAIGGNVTGPPEMPESESGDSFLCWGVPLKPASAHQRLGFVLQQGYFNSEFESDRSGRGAFKVPLVTSCCFQIWVGSRLLWKFRFSNFNVKALVSKSGMVCPFKALYKTSSTSRCCFERRGRRFLSTTPSNNRRFQIVASIGLLDYSFQS